MKRKKKIHIQFEKSRNKTKLIKSHHRLSHLIVTPCHSFYFFQGIVTGLVICVSELRNI